MHGALQDIVLAAARSAVYAAAMVAVVRYGVQKLKALSEWQLEQNAAEEEARRQKWDAEDAARSQKWSAEAAARSQKWSAEAAAREQKWSVDEEACELSAEDMAHLRRCNLKATPESPAAQPRVRWASTTAAMLHTHWDCARLRESLQPGAEPIEMEIVADQDTAAWLARIPHCGDCPGS